MVPVAVGLAGGDNGVVVVMIEAKDQEHGLRLRIRNMEHVPAQNRTGTSVSCECPTHAMVAEFLAGLHAATVEKRQKKSLLHHATTSQR